MMVGKTDTHWGNVLVVGGCGFLGHHVVKQLLEEYDTSQIAVLDIHTKRHRLDGVSYYTGDISSKDLVQSTLTSLQPRVIIHCASPLASKGTARSFEQVNITGTRNLLECAAASAAASVFVYCSSSGVVHDTFSDLIEADESWPLIRPPQQPDLYLATKIVAEEMVLAANGKGGVLTAAIRPAVLFGEGDTQTVTAIIDRARAGKANVQIGSGLNMFDFTYVGNVAHSLLLAGQHLLNEPTASSSSGPVAGEAFFVTNDDPVPFWEFNRMLSREAGYPVAAKDIWIMPKWFMLVLAHITELLYLIFTLGSKKPLLTRQVVKTVCAHRTFKINKIKERLGYKPRVSMQEGIQRSVKWYLGLG